MVSVSVIQTNNMSAVICSNLFSKTCSLEGCDEAQLAPTALQVHAPIYEPLHLKDIVKK